MILYDYLCKNGHSFETFSTLAEFDMCKPCPNCGKPGERVIVAAPAMHGFETPLARRQREIYHQHNKTSHGSDVNGAVAWEPLAPSEQCQCGDCGSHRGRVSVTGVADPRKDVVI